MSTAEERMQNAIEELEQENRLLRARNERLEAELMQMQGRELKLQFALGKGSYEAVFGHLDMTPDELGNYVIDLQEKAALAAPTVQEPVGCVADIDRLQRQMFLDLGYSLSDPLYATPPAARRRPLEEWEIDVISQQEMTFEIDFQEARAFARAIEAAHGIKEKNT